MFCGEQLLVSYLRPSNIDPARHAWAILELLVGRLRRAWPQVKIIFRGDSGFWRWKTLRWCESHGVDYIVGLGKNTRLLPLAEPLMNAAAAAHATHGEKEQHFGWIDYAAAPPWDRARRVIVKAEHSAQGANPRFVVTSLQGDPQTPYDKVYGARGEMEPSGAR